MQTLETLESGDKERAMRVHVQLSPKPVLKLTVSSPSMGAELSFPPHSFTCFDANAEVDFTFRFSRVALALRGLKHTSEVLLRLSSCGQLLLMLKFTSAAGVDSYVEWQLDALDDLIEDEFDGEAQMRSQTPAQQPQGSKRAREPDLQGACSGATRLDTPTPSMNPDPGSAPSTDLIRRRLEEAWY